ncbi:hypothetical protein [Streptomyces sp. NPDC048669]|uniref:hypothetical protein n=1 Tax=Streptomyces sp. NPDC048669 TaxID=3155267 RepID=UPI003420E5A7
MALTALRTHPRGGRAARPGIADDKSNLIVHLGVLRAYGGRPPTGPRIVLEGQEEYGSAFDDYPPTDPARFACDAMVIADMGTIRPGSPTLTTGLRGAAEVVAEVRTLDEEQRISATVTVGGVALAKVGCDRYLRFVWPLLAVLAVLICGFVALGAVWT